MDFKKIDSVKNAEIGYWHFIEDPMTGVPYGEGEDAPQVLVLGLESDSAQKAQQKINARELLEDSEDEEEKKKKPRLTLRQRHEKNALEACALIGGFRNVQYDGRDLGTSEEDKMTFLCLQIVGAHIETDPEKKKVQRTFLEQVLAVSYDRSKYLGNGSSNSG